jgi:uncharacterized membrane protein YoaK (UPF0700 family)
VTADAGGRPAGGLVGTVRSRFLAEPRHGPLPALLLAMTVVTGMVDAVSILRMDRVFVANMTGNVVFVGFGVAGARGFSVAASATALAGFAVGAVAGGRLPAPWRADRARLLWTTSLVKLVVAAPVLVVAATSGVRSGRSDTYVLLALLAASMGVQNASVRQLAVPDLATNVVTTALTGLLADLPALGWRHPAIGYRLASVVSLFAGAAVGALLVLEVGPGAALDLGAVLLAAVGLTAWRAGRGGPGWTRFAGG